MHEEKRDGEAPLLELGGQLLDAGKGTGDVRVEKGECRALVFAYCRVQRRAGDDRYGREPLVDESEGVFFVDGIAERPQEGECECVRLLHLDQVLSRAYQLISIEWRDDLPVAVDALAYPDDPVARDDFGRCRQPAVLVVDLAPAGERHEFLEAFGRDEPDAPPGP